MENTSSNVHTQETVQLPPLEVAEVGVHPAPEQSVGGRALTLSPAAPGRRVGSFVARYGLELMCSRMPNGQKAQVIMPSEAQVVQPPVIG